MKYRRIVYIGCLSLALLLPAIVCNIDSYKKSHWSARLYLMQLTGLPESSLNTDTARIALLQHLPVGTPSVDVIAFLEQHDVVQDRFVGGQLMRYQIQSERSILGLLSDPPPLIAFPCAGTTYMIHFTFDEHQRIHDIGIDSKSVCL